MIKVANLKIAFRPLKYSILRQFIKEIQQNKKKKREERTGFENRYLLKNITT